MAYKYIYLALVKLIFTKKQLHLLTIALALYWLVTTKISAQSSARLKLISRNYRKEIMVSEIDTTSAFFFSKRFSRFIAESKSYFLICFTAFSISIQLARLSLAPLSWLWTQQHTSAQFTHPRLRQHIDILWWPPVQQPYCDVIVLLQGGHHMFNPPFSQR